MSKRKFTVHPMAKEICAAQCFQCRHYHFLELRERCDAFPIEIPMQISLGNHDHSAPFDGDGGIVFERLSNEEMKERIRQIDANHAKRKAQRLTEDLAIAK